MPTYSLQTQKRTAQYFTEDFGGGVQLEMVLIPGDTFWMGSPDNEPERSPAESPRHQVTVPSFFMGKYPITQAQWGAIAKLPQVDRTLKSNPSSFKGKNNPVDSVSWLDAIEFCKRLQNLTKRPYTLPSEAQWEYACRAGTETPFYFGETLTTDLANYDGNYTYNDGPDGIYREKTTPVGSFPPNAFGLYDMHGNVWEWCLDDWHDDYEGAPKDGSVWCDRNAENDSGKVLRGGSWIGDPGSCLSARRLFSFASAALNSYGFRVVCTLPRTL